MSAGATLGGNGTITGSAAAAGIVTAGPTAGLGSVGTLSIGSLTLGSALSLDLPSASNADQIVTSGVTITGATLSLNLGTIVVGDQYTILKVDGVTSGHLNGLPEGQTFSISGVQFKITYAGGTFHNDVVLTALTSGSGTSLVSTTLNKGNTYINSTLATAQHSMVESVVYSFNSAVSLSPSNFAIIGKPGSGTSIVPTLTVTPNSDHTVWTVTFSAPVSIPA